MEASVRAYLSRIGRAGGKKSRRALSSEAAKRMVQLREARRAYQRFHTQCFWSFDPAYRVTGDDISWVAARLRTYGGADGYRIGIRLCR